MNKQKFGQYLHNQEVLKKTNLKEIEDLQESYPYSQVLHTLSAIVSYKQKTKDAKHKLNIAAVYATDRSVLKEAILAQDKPVSAPLEKTVPKKEETLPKVQAAAQSSSQKEVSSAPPAQRKPVSKPSSKKAVIDKPTGHPGHLTSKEAEELRQEVMKNLEDLMLVKSRFMEIVDRPEESEVEAKKKPKKEKQNKKAAVKEPELKITKSPKPAKTNSSKPLMDKKPKVAKKEQSQIIERFIKGEPSIKKGKSKIPKDEQNDLSVHSVEFGEDLVSENLAKIMIKQGKKDKAADIYKKLIWKYPQKKAYFASQIESLKEK